MDTGSGRTNRHLSEYLHKQETMHYIYSTLISYLFVFHFSNTYFNSLYFKFDISVFGTSVKFGVSINIVYGSDMVSNER